MCSSPAENKFTEILPFYIKDKSDRINLFEFRMIVEVESAYIAALRADTAIIQALNDSAVKCVTLQPMKRSQNMMQNSTG